MRAHGGKEEGTAVYPLEGQVKAEREFEIQGDSHRHSCIQVENSLESSSVIFLSEQGHREHIFQPVYF